MSDRNRPAFSTDHMSGRHTSKLQFIQIFLWWVVKQSHIPHRIEDKVLEDIRSVRESLCQYLHEETGELHQSLTVVHDGNMELVLGQFWPLIRSL